MTKDPWVRVKDESELREGMAVLDRCSPEIRLIILRREPGVSHCNIHGTCTGWIIVPSICGLELACFARHIRHRCLYRLADDQLADDAEPETVVRERELVK